MRNNLKYYLISYNEMIISYDNDIGYDVLEHKYILIAQSEEKLSVNIETFTDIIDNIQVITKNDYFKKYINLIILIKINNYYKILQ